MESLFCFDIVDEIIAWSKGSVFIYPLTLSLLSALIFWLVFSYLPNERRKRKLRPVIDLDIINIRNKLFSIFDGIMRHSENNPSYFQEEIRSGLLSRDDIQLGLQNKCLNESYLYDKNVSHKLLSTGELLYRYSKQINYLIDKVFNFSHFVHADEILHLEKIREEIRKYDYGDKEITKSAETRVGSNIFYPVVPNLHYRIENFVNLYGLFVELQRMILSNSKYIDRGVVISNVQYYYGIGDYSRCKSYINKYEDMYPNDRGLFRNYAALCEFKRGNKEKYYAEINSIYKDRPYSGSLVSSRGFLDHLMGDNKAIEILSKYHSKEEIDKFIKIVNQEKLERDNFIKSNKLLSEYFSKKDNRLSPIE